MRSIAEAWFKKETISSRFLNLDGEVVEHPVQIRVNPITGRRCRITFSRSNEKEAGTDCLPLPPPDAQQTATCPFCRPQVLDRTPRLISQIHPAGRMTRGESLLFPNLFPYGPFSAVSLFDNSHFVEIGKADALRYADCLVNCADYLNRVKHYDPLAIYMAITQNHLPSAGGSLVHPHLQVHVDRFASNHHRYLYDRTGAYRDTTRRGLLSDYAIHEIKSGSRYIGRTGPWEWMAAFAPEGFFEIWAVYSGRTSLLGLAQSDWHHLANGMIRVQRFYRSLNRNGYNFGLLAVERDHSSLELRAVMTVRANYAPWVRSDQTGFEVMLGDMATFTAPEETASRARLFWKQDG